MVNKISHTKKEIIITNPAVNRILPNFFFIVNKPIRTKNNAIRTIKW